jgi:ABC-2 type transport system ATP-binding protein
MKQRLQIARGLVNDPEVLFLDEPTLGLDPVGARDLRRIISSLIERGKTLLLTTHYMYEADELCHRIAVINNGKIAALDTPRELKRFAAGLSVLELSVLGVDREKVNAIKKEINPPAISVKQQDQMQKIEIQSENPSSITQDVLRILKDVKVSSMSIREATLEDAYIKLVGGEL